MERATLRLFLATCALSLATPACGSSSAGATSGGTPDASSSDAARAPEAGRDARADAASGGDAGADCGIEVTPPIGTLTASNPISDCTCVLPPDSSCNSTLVVEATGWDWTSPGRVMNLQFQSAGASIAGNVYFETVFGPATPTCSGAQSYTLACTPGTGCSGGIQGFPAGQPITVAFAEVYSTEADFQAAPPGDTKNVYVYAVWGAPTGATMVYPDAYNPVPIVFKKTCN